MGMNISYKNIQDEVLDDCRQTDDSAMRSRVKNWINEGYMDFVANMPSEFLSQFMATSFIYNSNRAIALTCEADRISLMFARGIAGSTFIYKKLKYLSVDEFDRIALTRTPQDREPEYYTITTGATFDNGYDFYDNPFPGLPWQAASSSNADIGKKFTVIGASTVSQANAIRPKYGPNAHYQFTLNGTTAINMTSANLKIDTLIGISKEQTSGIVQIFNGTGIVMRLVQRETTHYVSMLRFYPIPVNPNWEYMALIRQNPTTLFYDSDAPFLIPERFVKGVIYYAKYKALQYSEDKRGPLAFKEYMRIRSELIKASMSQEGESGFEW